MTLYQVVLLSLFALTLARFAWLEYQMRRAAWDNGGKQPRPRPTTKPSGKKYAGLIEVVHSPERFEALLKPANGDISDVD